MPELPVLLRIPFSHFCRKAEWGLSHAGIEYDALDVKLWEMKNAKRANPKEGTVPVLRVANKVVFGSHNIMTWAEEYKAGDALPLYPHKWAVHIGLWESWADESVGPVTRREAYREMHERPKSFRGYPDVKFWMTLPPARRLYLGVLKHYRTRRYDATDPAAMQEIVAKVAERLAKAGTDYLFADYPTAADYATAALLEPSLPCARRRGYDQEPGWGAVQDFVQRVRPAKTTRHSARRVREADWRSFETIHAGHHGNQ